MIEKILQDINILPTKWVDETKKNSFWKTNKDQYAYGDIVLGKAVPDLRKLAKKYILDYKNGKIIFDEFFFESVVNHKIHEMRTVGLIILVYIFNDKKSGFSQDQIVDIYLKNIEGVNHWDLVDLSCRDILGKYLLKKDRKILIDFSNSGDLRKERIGIVSTWTFIKNGDFDLTLQLAKKYLTHKHDLIQKASGWMLREIGKKDKKVLLDFLSENEKNMPSIMKSYAKEHLKKY